MILMKENMPTFNINASLDKMLQNMLQETIENCVTKLSEKYEFDKEEAKEFLKLNGFDGLNDYTEEKKGKKEKKDKDKKETDTKKPKKTSGYLLYSSNIRDNIKAELIKDGSEAKPKNVIQAIAAKWKELPEQEKEEWNEKAKAIKESS